MTDKWWTSEETRDHDGDTYRVRSRWAVPVPDLDGRRDNYRAGVLVSQHDDEDTPSVSLWPWSGRTPAMTLTVDEARALGYALLDAAEIVDRERDAAIRRLTENTP